MTATLIRVIPAVEGDLVTIDGAAVSVARWCECSSAPFYCLSCHQPLANFCQAELHVLEDARESQHVIARNCTVHGLSAL